MLTAKAPMGYAKRWIIVKDAITLGHTEPGNQNIKQYNPACLRKLSLFAKTRSDNEIY